MSSVPPIECIELAADPRLAENLPLEPGLKPSALPLRLDSEKVS